MAALFLFAFTILVGVPLGLYWIAQNNRLARRDESLGIYDGPHQSGTRVPQAGPYAYTVGDRVWAYRPDNGAVVYATVIGQRMSLKDGLLVTLQELTTGQIAEVGRYAWKKVV